MESAFHEAEGEMVSASKSSSPTAGVGKVVSSFAGSLDAVISKGKVFPGPWNALGAMSTSMHALGAEMQGDDEAAEKASLRALEQMQNAQGKNHALAIAMMGQHGMILDKHGRHPEADKWFCEASDLARDCVGRAVERARKDPEALGDSISQLELMSALADKLKFANRYEQAEGLYQVLLEAEEKDWEEGTANRVKLCKYLDNIAGTLKSRGRGDDARLVYQRLFDQMRQYLARLPANDAMRISQATDLALMRWGNGEHEEAEQSLLQLLEDLGSARPGPDQPGYESYDYVVLTTTGYLAGVLKDQKKFSEAESLYRETLRQYRKFMDPADCGEGVLILAYNIGYECAVRGQGRHDDADAVRNDSVVEVKKILRGGTREVEDDDIRDMLKEEGFGVDMNEVWRRLCLARNGWTPADGWPDFDAVLDSDTE